MIPQQPTPGFALHGSRTGTGGGLNGPPCPARDGLDQTAPAGGVGGPGMCVRCGRVTARRDRAGLAWCAGTGPEPGG
jgi:hypothetical protein